MRAGARLVVAGSLVALSLAMLAPAATAQSQVEGELNRGKAALQLKNYDKAAMRFGKLVLAREALKTRETC